MHLTFTQTSALVTGSSRGIGRAVAHAIADEGIGVTVAARTEGDVAAVVDELRARDGKAVGVAVDLDTADGVARALDTAAQAFGPVDLLVNSVGAAARGTVMDVSDDDWDAAFALKLMTAVRATRGVLPHMRAQGSGTIINVAGLAGRQPKPHQVVVGAVNAALANFTRAVSRDVASDGVRVNLISPGLVETSRTEQYLSAQTRATGRTYDDVKAAAVSAIPAGRMARPEEIAAAVLFLASDAAAHLHGSAIDVDGGETFGMP